MGDNWNEKVALNDDEKRQLVEKKITCPFVGSAVAEDKLVVRNSTGDPLARIEDVKNLGNTGGGDLGDLLALFAAGNHAFMRGASGRLDKQVPNGLFSLEFPGSQGAHAGHSGILMRDPQALGSGELSRPNFDRLADRARNGVIKRSDVGRFIAENLVRDPNSKVFGIKVVTLFGSDLFSFVTTIGPALMGTVLGSTEDASRAHREFEEKFTKLTGDDNLFGSSGEFGLLFALLANKPCANKIGDEPTVAVRDLEAMFVEKRFPEGVENWKKLRADWVVNTIGLAVSAAKEFLALRQTQLRANP